MSKSNDESAYDLLKFITNCAPSNDHEKACSSLQSLTDSLAQSAQRIAVLEQALAAAVTINDDYSSLLNESTTRLNNIRYTLDGGPRYYPAMA